MIKLDEQFRQDLIKFCDDTDTSVEWKYGYSSDQSADSFINRGRKFIFVAETPFADKVKLVVEQISEMLGDDITFRATNENDKLNHFITSLYPNSEGRSAMGIQKHTDPRNDQGWPHVRFNFMIQKPEEGGEPVIGNRMIPVKEGQLWNCWASEDVHFALPVIDTSARSRIVLSLGFFIEESCVPEAKRRIEKIVDVSCN